MYVNVITVDLVKVMLEDLMRLSTLGVCECDCHLNVRLVEDVMIKIIYPGCM